MLIFDLKKFRVDQNLTQQQVADLFKVPQSSISSIENGKQDATSAQIETLQSSYKFDVGNYLKEVDDSRSTKNRQNDKSEGVPAGLAKSLMEMITQNSDYLQSERERYANLIVNYKDALDKIDMLKDEIRRLERRIFETELALSKKGIEL